MMGYDGWGFFGMHALWWLFWILVIGAAVVFLFQAPTRRASDRETPLEILQRRYAAGEISEKQYEEHKTKLERDVKPR